MSTPGVQLNSEPHLTHFPPSIRQYLQGVEEALTSNNLPAAQQAFAQLKRTIPLSSQAGGGRQTNELALHISESLAVVGKSLSAGDLSGAAEAFGKIHQNLQAYSSQQSHEKSVSVEPAVSSPSQDGDSESGASLNVRV